MSKFHNDIYLWNTINNVLTHKELAEKIYFYLEGKAWTISEIEYLERRFYYE